MVDTVKVRSDRSRGGASGMVAAAPAEQQMQMVRQDVTWPHPKRWFRMV